MPRNIEIKARLATAGAGGSRQGGSGSAHDGAAGIDAIRARVEALADGHAESIVQDDTFFGVGPGNAGDHAGRLKLRVFGDGSGELISYRRADAAGPKASDYRRAPVADPAALRATLGHALGETARVVKHRILLLVGRTRVHLDRVEGLGDFLELEVVLGDGEDDAAGIAEADALLDRLGIGRDQLVSGAYADLLQPDGAADGALRTPSGPATAAAPSPRPSAPP